LSLPPGATLVSGEVPKPQIKLPPGATLVSDGTQARSVRAESSKPNALQRFSEVTLGTQHPIDELVREAKDVYAHPLEGAKSLGELAGLPRNLWSHPAKELGNIGGTGILGMLFGENGLLRHPFEFGKSITGANQAAEDIENKNWKGLPGDIAGGVTNLAMFKKPVEAGGQDLAAAARNAKVGIADVVRTPENKLTPATKAVARIGGAAAGHALGVPGAGELAGIFTGPSLADAFLPKRPELTNFYGGAYTEMEPLAGQVIPMTKSPYYAKFQAARKAVNAPEVRTSPFEGMIATDKPIGNAQLPSAVGPPSALGPTIQLVDKFSAPGKAKIVSAESEPPDIKVTYQSVPQPDLLRMVKAGDRTAINEWQRRGLQLPENVGYMVESGAGKLPWRNYRR